MNKFKSLLLAAVVGIAAIKTVEARSSLAVGDNANFSTLIDATSGQIFTGAGIVYKVLVGTGNGADYSLQLDSAVTGTALTGLAAFPSATQWGSFPLVALATNTVNGSGTNYSTVDYGPSGKRFKNGCFIFHSAGGIRTEVIWSR